MEENTDIPISGISVLYNKAKSFDKADIDMKIMIMSDVVPTASSKMNIQTVQ